jgi:hypothetical protein
MATKTARQYTRKQSRQGARIRERYERRGFAQDEADRRAAAARRSPLRALIPAKPPRQPKTASADLGRQLICKEFARIAAQGYGHFRARWFPQDERVQFQGERANRWESISHGDRRGVEARSIAIALQAVRAKRNRDIQIKTHEKPDRSTFEVRVDKTALESHGRHLTTFWNAQLFWE